MVNILCARIKCSLADHSFLVQWFFLSYYHTLTVNNKSHFCQQYIMLSYVSFIFKHCQLLWMVYNQEGDKNSLVKFKMSKCSHLFLLNDIYERLYKTSVIYELFSLYIIESYRYMKIVPLPRRHALRVTPLPYKVRVPTAIGSSSAVTNTVGSGLAVDKKTAQPSEQKNCYFEPEPVWLLAK